MPDWFDALNGHFRYQLTVLGLREDAFAKAHRIPVEEEKTVAERGRYLMPQLFGQPASKAIGAGG
jgi:hypothetical protein